VVYFCFIHVIGNHIRARRPVKRPAGVSLQFFENITTRLMLVRQFEKLVQRTDDVTLMMGMPRSSAAKRFFIQHDLLPIRFAEAQLTRFRGRTCVCRRLLPNPRKNTLSEHPSIPLFVSL
jgi:hypothetical protein